MKIIVDHKTIRKRMIDLDIKSITELSQKSGVSKPKIHQYLNGSSPIATTFCRLCDFLELDPAEVVQIIDENTGGGKND